MASNTDDLANILAVSQLAGVIWSADDAIVGKRLDGTITSWNQGAEQLFGYAAEEILGQSILRLLPSERRHEEDRIIALLVRGERVRPFETVRLRKDGTRVDVSVSVSPIKDASDRVVGATKVARNITDLVATRARERRLKQFMRAHVRASRAIAKSTAEDGLFDEICGLCIELEGVRAAFVVETDHAALHVPAFAGLTRPDVDALVQQGWLSEVVAQVMASGRASVAGMREGALTEPGGAAVAALPFRRGPNVSGSLVLVADSEGLFDDAIMELLDDLAADLSFAATTHARTAEFEGIVQSASDAIIAVDADRRILRINPAASEMFLWPESEAIGQSIDRLVPERYRAGHAALMERFANLETSPRRMGPARALAGCRSDGSEFPIEATVSRFGSGPGLRMIVAIRDVSERRDAELAQLARKQAEAANRAKSEFLSYMSHELRTPLNAVLGFAQVLLDERGTRLDERQLAQVRQIRTAGKHLHVLITDLLDMGRIEAGQLTVNCQPLAIQDVLDEVLVLIEAMAKSAALQFDPPHGLTSLPPVLADATRLRQVLLNLLSNAVKYNRPRGSVAIEATASEGAVTVSVRDTGMGMSDDQLAQLFTPYNRLGREDSQVHGTGIGLVVSKSLVDLMNATLRFDSTPGVGTTAYLTLPTAEGADVLPRPAESAFGELDGLPITGRVLSVEDNPVNQMLIEAVCSRWPQMELSQALDGRGGLQQARERMPDVVLLDMNLPDMDGFQFMRELAAEFPLHSIKVIILSATAEAQDIERAMAKGASAYLTKPIDLPVFTSTLAAVLGAAH